MRDGIRPGALGVPIPQTVLLFSLLAPLVVDAGAVAHDVYPAPDYRTAMVRFFDAGLRGINKLEGRFDPGAADIALSLWEATGESRFEELGTTLFTTIVLHMEKRERGRRFARKYGDFDSHPILHAAFVLKQRGRLKPEWESLLRSEVLALQAAGLHWRYGNRELGKLAGPIFAAFSYFAGDPSFAPLRAQARNWWRDLNAVGCLDESSGNYSSLGLSLLVCILQSMECEADLRTNPRWRNTFTMYRDLVSPSGHMPEWGDDYFAEGGEVYVVLPL